ncbi:hypothetical protein KKG58_00145 [Patescibacteria group bacterium]|nr:hypothetical protein [Patescibacteria group bacterium]
MQFVGLKNFKKKGIVMKDNVFFVSFEKKEPQIIHSKCGTTIQQTVLDGEQEVVCFFCPLCHSDTVYFSEQAWKRIVKKLERSPEGYRITIHKNFSIGREVVFSKEVATLERKNL